MALMVGKTHKMAFKMRRDAEMSREITMAQQKTPEGKPDSTDQEMEMLKTRLVYCRQINQYSYRRNSYLQGWKS
jgi:hypothetical protein